MCKLVWSKHDSVVDGTNVNQKKCRLFSFGTLWLRWVSRFKPREPWNYVHRRSLKELDPTEKMENHSLSFSKHENQPPHESTQNQISLPTLLPGIDHPRPINISFLTIRLWLFQNKFWKFPKKHYHNHDRINNSLKVPATIAEVIWALPTSIIWGQSQ